MVQTVNSLFKIEISQNVEKNLYEEIKKDILEKEIFLDKFDTDEFTLQFENIKFINDIYFC